MKKNLKRNSEDGWTNIRIRTETVKRLRKAKANMEVPLYDDVINHSLNLLEKMDIGDYHFEGKDGNEF